MFFTVCRERKEEKRQQKERKKEIRKRRELEIEAMMEEVDRRKKIAKNNEYIEKKRTKAARQTQRSEMIIDAKNILAEIKAEVKLKEMEKEKRNKELKLEEKRKE